MAHPTRARLLDVAERLFAERGIAAVSLREIGAAARQRNTAAVLYHFGSKQALVEAILATRMASINAHRLALLGAAGTRDGDVRALAETLVLPLADAIRPGSCYARFLAQAMADPTGARLVALELAEMEGVRRFAARADAALPLLPPGLRRQRLSHAGRLVVHALAEYERVVQQAKRPVTSLPVLVADLLDVVAALLTAPVSARTRGTLRAGLRSRA